jgi:hypothetical protein
MSAGLLALALFRKVFRARHLKTTRRLEVRAERVPAAGHRLPWTNTRDAKGGWRPVRGAKFQHWLGFVRKKTLGLYPIRERPRLA